ncbi:hypothetical protein GCM10022198_24760 [Klugiella xanthotipulae]|uniref:Phospholipase D-like protein n=1 Tax=Klugiella xanthotipulae TaxID=244735 RepID=A0A543HZ80_9MICO|nr:PLDc N-terminal domain-containing protein [Klugiella xanthotipulae]TQM63631.1 phospholipase D-like protein [Klugiella xanthotipulae]
MIRLLFVGAVVGVIFTLYALVDAAMSDPKRARGVNKSIWVVVIAVLPVVGGILWFTMGRGQIHSARPLAPDDDPAFTRTTVRDAELDKRIQDIERELAELDSEVYPGDRPHGDAPTVGDAQGTPDETDRGDLPQSETGTDPEPGRPGGPRTSND